MLKLFKIGGCLVFLISLSFNSPAQNQEKYFSIEYVGQFPPIIKQEKKDNNWFVNLFPENTFKKNWFSDLIFGKAAPNLNRPISVIGFKPDSMLILDQGNGILFNVENGVGDMTQFKNNKHAVFPSLIGSCLFYDRKILFTDSKLNKVFIYSQNDKLLAVLNDTLILNSPTGIAYSTINQQIWIIETNAHRITILNKNGELIKRIGTRGNAPGQFNYPTFIWIDKMGIVYVIDTMNFRVQMFDKAGNFISAFGEAGNSSGNFARPKGIATDSFGNIYVADALFHNIQVFNKEGRLLEIIGTKGIGSGEFTLPVGLYIDKNDFIYVADSYNSRVQVFKVSENE
ncbi:MAG: 6-bladed beta-propeller [Draconibacterium sp.]|nr:6-bladed beta-propeller [Draconibacterium sp.]